MSANGATKSTLFKEIARLQSDLSRLTAEVERLSHRADIDPQALMEMRAHLEMDIERLTAENARLEEERRWRKYPEERPTLGNRYYLVEVERVAAKPRFETVWFDQHEGWDWVGKILRWLSIPGGVI